jgi:hypothetical protein
MHIYMKRLKIYNYIFLIFLRPLWNYWPPFKFLINIVLIGNPKFTRPLTFIINVRDIVNTGFPIKYTRCCNWQPGQGSSTSAGNVWKDGDASGSSVGPVLETVINTIYLKIIYLLNIYNISLSGDWLLYKGIPHQETKDQATRTLLKTDCELRGTDTQDSNYHWGRRGSCLVWFSGCKTEREREGEEEGLRANFNWL